MSEREAFYDNKEDFGIQPAERVLTEAEKQISVYNMALNAAIATLISEGAFPPGQQVHLMVHLQDFVQRLYQGETVRLPGVFHTLKLDSRIGTLFADAAKDALSHGTETFKEFQKAVREAQDKAEQDNNEGAQSNEPTRTFH